MAATRPFCPKDCSLCAFSPKGEEVKAIETTVVSAESYGCVKGFGAVVKQKGILGQLRDKLFHPVSPDGKAFYQASGSPLAQLV